MTLLDRRTVGATDAYEVDVQAPTIARYLRITNDSPYICGYYFGSQQADVQYLSPTQIVENEHPIARSPHTLDTWSGKINIVMSAPSGGTPTTDPQASQVTIEGFAAPVTAVRSSLVRNVNSGVLVAQKLQGAGQSLILTEQDISGVASLTPGPGANAGLNLAANDNLGNAQAVLQAIGGVAPVVQVNGELIVFSSTGPMELGMQNGQMVFYKNEALGGVGVSSIVSLVQDQQGSGTLTNVLASYPVPNDGSLHAYRISAHVVLGTAGSISVQVQYNNRANAVTTSPLFTSTSTAIQVANGATAFGLGTWPFAPVCIVAKPGTSIFLQYKNPAGAGSDFVSMWVERIS